MRYTTIIDIRELPAIYRNVNARLVYLHMVLASGYHDNDRDQTEISIRRISYETNLTISAVRHALGCLERAGLISRTGITWTVKKFVLETSITPRVRSEKKRREAENAARAKAIQEEQEQREKEETRKYREMRKHGDPLRDQVLDLMKRADAGDTDALETLETSIVYKSMYKQIKASEK